MKLSKILLNAKNRYGNVEVARMGKRLYHDDRPRIGVQAKKAKVPYFPAVVGFEKSGGSYFPKISGIVYLKSHKAKVDKAFADKKISLRLSYKEKVAKKAEKIKKILSENCPHVPEWDIDSIAEHQADCVLNRKGVFYAGFKDIRECGETNWDYVCRMAVAAHVRHQYTDYDWDIKDLGKDEARSLAQEIINEKFDEWKIAAELDRWE